VTEECGYVWTDWDGDSDTEHTCCLNTDSDIHADGGHGCACGERGSAEYDDEEGRWF
jgi:hypothetical protein